MDHAQFTSDKFEQFVRANNSKHSKSSPYHPATNGLAERFIQSLHEAGTTSIKEREEITLASGIQFLNSFKGNGAILRRRCYTKATDSVYLNRQHFCGDNTCQKLFLGHVSVCKLGFPATRKC